MTLAADRGSVQLRARQAPREKRRINGGPYTESQVEFRIWEKLSSGALPLRMPQHATVDDCPSAITCGACDELIPVGQAMVAPEMDSAHPLHFHPLCYYLLDSARRKMEIARKSSISLRYVQGVPAY